MNIDDCIIYINNYIYYPYYLFLFKFINQFYNKYIIVLYNLKLLIYILPISIIYY
jgi:hypothetical protein